MAQKLKLRDLGMDTMERLYYERKETRQKAYAAKQRKLSMKKGMPAKRFQKEYCPDTCDRILKKAI